MCDICHFTLYKSDIIIKSLNKEMEMKEKKIQTPLRLDESLKKAIEEMAKQEGRSFNNMVNWLLYKSVK